MADKPVTREEKYLAYLTGDYTGELPKPITRKEKYLYELCLKGIGGEISPEEIKAAVNEYLEKNPVKPGATTEQTQQIEQNKTDITSLKTDIDNVNDAIFLKDENKKIEWVPNLIANAEALQKYTNNQTSKPFLLKAGETVKVKTKGNGEYWFNAISRVPSIDSKIEEHSVLLENLVSIDSNQLKEYTYTANETIPLIACTMMDETSSITFSNLKKDSKIEELSTAVTSLKEDISTKITKFYASNQGETHITDSDSGKIQDMVLYGKSEQNQYKGINLLPTDISYLETIEVSIPKGTHIFWATDGTPALGGNFRFYNEDKTQETWFRVDAGKTAMTSTINIDVKYIQYLISKDQSVKMCLGIGDNPVYEPYTGGQPSPSPDYPQEIKSVVNPTVKVTNEDGLKVQSVTLNNITLNAIPVSSGGNVTIDGKQYIADYVDVERGKHVQMIQTDKVQSNITWNIQKQQKGYSLGYTGLYKNGISTDKPGMGKTWKSNVGDSSDTWSNAFSFGKSTVFWIIPYENDGNITSDDINAWLVEHPMNIMYPLAEPIETDLTPEENEAFKALVTNYPVTNISVTSDQLDGYTVFNYPISMANGWNYVKQQLNDNRDYIYDMDLQSAEAYVNSEYAVALTELEV